MGHWPVGTPKEVVELGMAGDVKVCGPSQVDAATGVAMGGCQFYNNCRFRLPQNGGFRDKGPRNIGYFIKVDPAESVNGYQASKQDYTECYTWMVALDNRFAQQENTGETIGIIAQEGEPIVYREITYDKQTDGTMKQKVVVNKDFKVPAFPRPIDRYPDLKYAQDIKNARLAGDDAARNDRVQEQIRAIPEPKRDPKA